MTIYLEVNNNPQDINDFVENPLSLPYRVIKTTLIPESEQVLIELNWLSSDTSVILDFHQLSNIKDIYKVIQANVGKWSSYYMFDSSEEILKTHKDHNLNYMKKYNQR